MYIIFVSRTVQKGQTSPHETNYGHVKTTSCHRLIMVGRSSIQTESTQAQALSDVKEDISGAVNTTKRCLARSASEDRNCEPG